MSAMLPEHNISKNISLFKLMSSFRDIKSEKYFYLKIKPKIFDNYYLYAEKFNRKQTSRAQAL
jgi:hypothetical protein